LEETRTSAPPLRAYAPPHNPKGGVTIP